MAESFGSFYGSPLGAFYQSTLLARGNPGPTGYKLAVAFDVSSTTSRVYLVTSPHTSLGTASSVLNGLNRSLAFSPAGDVFAISVVVLGSVWLYKLDKSTLSTLASTSFGAGSPSTGSGFAPFSDVACLSDGSPVTVYTRLDSGLNAYVPVVQRWAADLSGVTWTQEIIESASRTDDGSAGNYLAVDANDNIYLMHGGTTGTGVIYRVYDKDGNALTSASGPGLIGGGVVTSDGAQLYCARSLTGGATRAARHDLPSLTPTWIAGDLAVQADLLNRVCDVDPAGTGIAAINFFGSRIKAIDLNGNALWLNTISGPWDAAYGVADGLLWYTGNDLVAVGASTGSTVRTLSTGVPNTRTRGLARLDLFT